VSARPSVSFACGIPKGADELEIVMSRAARRSVTAVTAGFLLVLAMVGPALGYEDVHIPPAACDSVLAGIAHFHDSPAPENMMLTPAWSSTSRFVYDRCD
jgi:hypothetical protein